MKNEAFMLLKTEYPSLNYKTKNYTKKIIIFIFLQSFYFISHKINSSNRTDEIDKINLISSQNNLKHNEINEEFTINLKNILKNDELI